MHLKYNNILAPTAIKVLLLGLYGYGIAVTTILVLMYCVVSVLGRFSVPNLIITSYCENTYEHKIFFILILNLFLNEVYSW